MTVRYIKIALVSLAVFTVSCNRLQLPDNFMEVNRQNSPFMEAVGSIDKAQTWNLAKDGLSIDSVTVEEVSEEAGEENGTKGPSTKAADTKAQTVSALAVVDFFSYSDGTSFTVSTKWKSSGASRTSIGLYYYDSDNNIVEKVIYSSMNNIYNKPVNITLNGGSMFGFYIESTVDKKTSKYYSEAVLNSDGIGHVKHKVEGEYSWGRWNYSTYFYFEDLAGGDYDYNDVVIQVDKKIDALDYDRGPWMLLCEDLGSIADNDFNDVILKVNRTSKTSINVEFVANGASLKNYAYFNGEMIGKEIHSMFGVNDFNILINTTKKDGDVYTHPTLDFNVDPSFTMSATNMGGFIIQRGVFTSLEYDINQTGETPFMLCVPGSFRWPAEGVPIFQAYPDFEKWARDKSTNKTWYTNAVDTLVVTPKL